MQLPGSGPYLPPQDHLPIQARRSRLPTVEIEHVQAERGRGLEETLLSFTQLLQMPRAQRTDQHDIRPPANQSGAATKDMYLIPLRVNTERNAGDSGRQVIEVTSLRRRATA